jgi:hypothetical protein
MTIKITAKIAIQLMRFPKTEFNRPVTVVKPSGFGNATELEPEVVLEVVPSGMHLGVNPAPQLSIEHESQLLQSVPIMLVVDPEMHWQV